jgi:hypothetical protein
MRMIVTLSAAMILGAFTIIGASQSIAAPSTSSTASSRKANCDAQRKACYGGKTQTGSNGERYVPPDAVKECESGYRMCMGRN